MSKRSEVSFSMELRGRKVEVTGIPTDADPDVGIMSAGIEDYKVVDEGSGIELLNLTDEEETKIQERAGEFLDDYYSDDYDLDRP